MPKSNIFNYDIDTNPNSFEAVYQNNEIHEAAKKHPMTKDAAYLYFLDLDDIKNSLENNGNNIAELEEYRMFSNAVEAFGKKATEYQNEHKYVKNIVQDEGMNAVTSMASEVIRYGRALGKKLSAPEYESSGYAKKFKEQFKLWVDCICDGYAYGIPEAGSEAQNVTTDDIAARELKNMEAEQNQLVRENELKQAEIAINGPEPEIDTEAVEPKKNLFGLPVNEQVHEASVDIISRYHVYLTKIGDSIKDTFSLSEDEYGRLEEALLPLNEITSKTINEYDIPNAERFSIKELVFIRDLKKAADKVLDLGEETDFDEIEGALTTVNNSGYMLGLDDKSQISHLGNIAFVAKRMAKEKVEKPAYRIAEYLDEVGSHLYLKRRAAEADYVELFAEERYLDNLQTIRNASKELDSQNKVDGAVIGNLDTKAIREKANLTSTIEEADAIAEIYDDLTEKQKFKLEVIQRNNELIASRVPNKKMSDEEIANMVLDTSEDEVKEKLSFMAGYYPKRLKVFHETATKMGIDPALPPMITRIAVYDIDMAGTPEAEEKNRDFIKSLMTKDGQTKYAEQVLRTVLNEPLSTYCPRNEEEIFKLCQEKTKLLYYGFVVGDIPKHHNDLPVDATLMNMVSERLTVIQSAGHTINYGESKGSLYSGTLPQLNFAEMAMASVAFKERLKKNPEELEKYGLHLTLIEGDDLFERGMNYLVSAEAGETTYASISDFMDNMDLQNVPIGKLVGYGNDGQLNFDTAFLNLQKDIGGNFSIGLGTPEQQAQMQSYLDGESVNKEKNAIDYAKKYDEDEARLAKINEDYSKRSEGIQRTLSSLNSIIRQYGLSLDDPKSTAALVAIVDDGNGNPVKQPLFTEFPKNADSLMMNRVDLQTTVNLKRAIVESKLTKQRLMQIEDLINEGRVFIEVPGQHFDKAMHVYVQGADTKGNVSIGISKPGENSEEPVYYGGDKDTLAKNREIGISLRNKVAEAEQKQLSELNDDERMVLEEKLASDANAWKKARVDAVDPDELWEGSFSDGIIIDKTIKFVSSSHSKGLSDAEIKEKYNSIDRQAKLSAEQMKSIFAQTKANIKVNATPDAAKAKLTKEARKQVLDIIIDKKNRIDAMDRSDPMLYAMEADRGLKSVLLDNTAPIEENIKIAKRWFGGDINEKSKVVNESLVRMNKVDASMFSLDASDEDIVKNYRDLYEKASGFTEVVALFSDLDKQGIKIDPELRKKTIEILNSLDAMTMFYHGRITMISSGIYESINGEEDKLTNPADINKVSSISENFDDREFNSFFAGASNALNGIELGLKSNIVAQMGLISERGIDEKIAFYDADGEQYTFNDSMYERSMKGEAIFAKNLQTGEVVPFTIDRNKKQMIDRTADRDLKAQADTVKYLLSRRAAPKSAIKQDAYVGRGLQKTYTELYKIVDDADSMFVHSSDEFRNIKKELDAIAKQDSVPNSDQARKSVEKIHAWAKKYISDKDTLQFNGKVFSAREKGRYDAIREIRNRTTEIMDTYSINKEGVSLMGGSKPAVVSEQQPVKYESFAKYCEASQSNPAISYDMRIANAAIKEIIAIQSAGRTAMNDVSVAQLADKLCKEGKIERITKEFAKLPSIQDVVKNNPESTQNIMKVRNGELTKGISIRVLKDIQQLGLKSLLEKAEPVKTLEQKKIEAPARNNNLSL